MCERGMCRAFNPVRDVYCHKRQLTSSCTHCLPHPTHLHQIVQVKVVTPMLEQVAATLTKLIAALSVPAYDAYEASLVKHSTGNMHLAQVGRVSAKKTAVLLLECPLSSRVFVYQGVPADSPFISYPSWQPLCHMAHVLFSLAG